MFRIVLLYAPPAPFFTPEDAKKSRFSGLLKDIDFLSAPLGLLSLHAQVEKAGYEVSTYNLSSFLWPEIETIVDLVDADLFGLSCFTVNRIGVQKLTDLIRAKHPNAHITVGGPFATALPAETLKFFKTVDSVVVGEGEATFLELCSRLDHRESLEGIAGMTLRIGDQFRREEPRERIRDLDSLHSPNERFGAPTIVTSRGCFERCTFCASPTLWGRKITSHSIEYVLDLLEKLVKEQGLKTLAFKDEVFTSNPNRVLKLCQGILDRGLRFLWSCDTRVDRINEQILEAMHRAGCQMLSFGVESGSEAILERIKKRTTPKQVLDATKLAKKFGFQIRYFFIWGFSTETRETIKRSIDLLERAKPTSVVFYPLAISPGSDEHQTYLTDQNLSSNFFFEQDFLVRTRISRRSPEYQNLMQALGQYGGYHEYWSYTVEDLEKIASRMPDSWSAHMSLSCAYASQGSIEQAQKHLDHAEELGYPIESIILNTSACIAALRGEISQAFELLKRAQLLGNHAIVRENIKEVESLIKSGSQNKTEGLRLNSEYQFSVENLPFRQPLFPGQIRL